MARPVAPSVVVAFAAIAKAVEETVSVVVALPVPRRKSPPVNEISPMTESGSHGPVVPMPTLPSLLIVIALVRLLKDVALVPEVVFT